MMYGMAGIGSSLLNIGVRSYDSLYLADGIALSLLNTESVVNGQILLEPIHGMDWDLELPALD